MPAVPYFVRLSVCRWFTDARFYCHAAYSGRNYLKLTWVQICRFPVFSSTTKTKIAF